MTNGSIEVIRARSSHLSDVEDLWRDIAREVEPNDEAAPAREVEGLNRSLQAFDFLESDSFWLLIARSGDKPIGYLTTVRIPKPDKRMGVLYIDELHVLKEHRRRGAGSALVQEVCDIVQELGFWRVRLNADQNDPGVCAFYEANGFKHSGDGFFQKEIPKKKGRA